ncbi:hypothetical protein C8J56DRAFT_895294 [Mycena floridula]|nr:hypothetical protein C8J56DRAFT_895294 [Mycena floridula]
MLRPSFAQHVRSFLFSIPQASSSMVFVRNQTGKGFVDPTDSERLLDTATAGEVATDNGQIYRIASSAPHQESLTSAYLQVAIFAQNIKDADIREAFSAFGPVEDLISREDELSQCGELFAVVNVVKVQAIGGSLSKAYKHGSDD